MRQRWTRAAALAAVGLVAGGLAAPGHAADPPLFAVNAGVHSENVNRARFLPNGRQLLTVSTDKTVRLWDVGTGAARDVFRLPIGPGDEGKLLALAVSPAGDLAAVAGVGPRALGGGQIYVLSLPEGRLKHVLVGHKEYVFGLAFSPDGARLASAGEDTTARIWDVGTGKEERVLRGHDGFVYGVAFSPDGASVATAAFDSTARVWSVRTGKATAVLRGHAGNLRCVEWSPDGKLLATGSWDKTARLWTPAGDPVRTIPNFDRPASAVLFTPDSKSLLVAAGGVPTSDPGASVPPRVRVFDTATGDVVVQTKPLAAGAIGDVALSPDGQTIAYCGGVEGGVFLQTAADATPVRSILPAADAVAGVGWSRSGQAVYWAGALSPSRKSAAGLVEWPLRRGFRFDRLAFTPDDDPGMAEAVTHRDGFGEATGVQRASRTALVFGRDGRKVSEMRLPLAEDAFTSGPSLSPDDDYVVVGSEAGGWVFRTDTGALANRLSGHSGQVNDAVFSKDGRYVLTGGSDRTLRVWAVGRDAPLVSLFAAGQEWVAWTPEGYYAASPGGEKLVGWHVNNGPDKPPTFHPAERFHDSLYRPDVIKLLLKHGDVAAALKEADEAAGHKTQKIDVRDVKPPDVKILSPAAPDSAVNAGRVTVRAQATSPRGVKELRLLVNGRLYDGEDGVRRFPGRNPTETASWTVDLPFGKNALKAVAVTGESDGASEVYTVRVGGGAEPGKPRLFVLAAGVADYEKAPKLYYCANAAAMVKDLFETQANPLPYEKVQVTLLRDAEVTRAGLLTALDKLATKGATRPEDVVVVYLAGHGDVPKGGPNARTWFYCCKEYDKQRPADTGVSADELRTRLARIDGRPLLVLDACHSGTFAADLTAGPVGAAARDYGRERNGAIDHLCSSFDKDESLESNKARMPAFTDALLAGLRGGAMKTADGYVNYDYLKAFVTDRVRAATKGAQVPTGSGKPNVIPLDLTKP